MSRYILFLGKLKGRGMPFFKVERRWGHIFRLLPQEHLVVIKDEKKFVKYETILPLPCFLLDHLTNKHCKTWSYIINLWIDSRHIKIRESCCQEIKDLVFTLYLVNLVVFNYYLNLVPPFTF